ncbi:alanine dehydrogenase [Leptospira adleri]|uniref:Alanine dehydrogenase n=1 Tax=Leptospira adleri TaxID=2023186 RepID=A0A2M9YUP7_9LEPT|nr:alanine dehydrogenase [Leptospira adleri]PJZ55263.1 alanine dehydrogenase [Leptospira adleri]PJZ62425.1 alanine dehydrogenase [Leptospira adleri]
MKIGILKEIKVAENRVSMIPAGVEVLKHHGHTVFVEKDAGLNSGFSDSDYVEHGAEILNDKNDIFKKSDMILHIKEPQPSEYSLLRENQILFTYLHLAASKDLTLALTKTNAVCIAYETIQKEDGSLPLLIPMSEIAGRMAAQEGARYLEMVHGGSGVLLGGVPGVEPGVVVVIGGGIVGMNSAKIAAGLGARVYILDTNSDRLRYLSEIMPSNCITLSSTPSKIRELLRIADVVIGSVLYPGAKAPRLVTRDHLRTMKKGSVLIDVAIDQGGCFETSIPTTHENPIYTVDGIIHYSVANMPGAVPKTSTLALTSATLPYVLEIANVGWKEAALNSEAIRKGINVVSGKITYRAVSDAFGMEYTNIDSMLGS